MAIVLNSGNSELIKKLERRPDGGGDTTQGFYVVGADGKLYGWFNAHHVPYTLHSIKSALEAYRRDPLARVEISQKEISSPYSNSPDSTTSVVRTFTRIRPLPAGCDDLNNAIGRDHLWIYADDVQAIEAASRNNKDKSFSLPKNLVARLVRFHLIDNVRGEPDDWESEDVKQANFTAQLVSQDTKAKHFQFHGVYSQEKPTTIVVRRALWMESSTSFLPPTRCQTSGHSVKVLPGEKADGHQARRKASSAW